MREAGLIGAVLLLCCAGLFGRPPTPADASQRVTLQAAFKPNRLDTSTTIEFGFRVRSATAGQIPSPVTNLQLDLPAGIGLATSTLGLAVCQPLTLLEWGLDGCSANARVGIGTATGKLAAEGEIVTETASVDAFLEPPVDENQQILFYVAGDAPVSAQLVFPGQIRPAPSPRYSGRLDTTIPLVPAWTDGPDIAVTSFRSTLGPLGLTYYRHVHGKIVPFHPRGIAPPTHCPQGGFPFAARFSFLDGSQTTAEAAVHCPRSHARGQTMRPRRK